MNEIIRTAVPPANPVKKCLYWLDNNIEKYLIVSSYSLMTVIIFVEIIRRFFFSIQAPWSTSIPVLLFLWLTWVGAAVNVKNRTHLSLTEIRLRLPYRVQFLCLILDAFLWLSFAGVVLYFASDQVRIAYDNFAIVQGTDDVMQWWFYMATPVGWTLIIYRVIQNFYQDYRRYRNNEPLILQTSLAEKEA
ncbi:TRAP transporter small permease [Vibrio bathopelagicus]